MTILPLTTPLSAKKMTLLYPKMALREPKMTLRDPKMIPDNSKMIPGNSSPSVSKDFCPRGFPNLSARISESELRLNMAYRLATLTFSLSVREDFQISSVQNNFYDNNFHVDYITNLKDIEL
jgi:hypothetical protein